MNLRPLDLARPGDAEALARIFSDMFRVPITQAEAVRRVTAFPADRPALRLMAERDGAVVGIGRSCYWGDDPTVWTVQVGVDENERRRGTGREIYTRCEEFCVERGAKTVAGAFAENQPGEAFVSSLGFEVKGRDWRQRCELVIADLGEAREFPGIDFVSFDQFNHKDKKELVYDCAKVTDEDVPNADSFGGLSRDMYERMFFQSPNFLPACCVLAVAGEAVVGMSAINSLEPGEVGRLETDYTGVRREFRRKGLATELKRRALLAARGLGGQTVDTQNSSENHGMLRINQKVGFVKTHEMVEVLKVVGR